jgi:hypothetical protein
MADIETRTGNSTVVARPATDWSAIWAGLFTFAGIWTVFGFLGYAIFMGGVSPQNVTSGMSIGLGIWAIVLAAVAMYVAGWQTGRLAALTGRTESALHGMIMFGLAVVAGAVLTVGGGLLLPTAAARFSSPASVNLYGGSGWIAFVALFVGWIAAISGAASGRGKRVAATGNIREVRDIRTAA